MESFRNSVETTAEIETFFIRRRAISAAIYQLGKLPSCICTYIVTKSKESFSRHLG